MLFLMNTIGILAQVNTPSTALTVKSANNAKTGSQSWLPVSVITTVHDSELGIYIVPKVVAKTLTNESKHDIINVPKLSLVNLFGTNHLISPVKFIILVVYAAKTCFINPKGYFDPKRTVTV